MNSAHTPYPPERIERPVMRQSWDRLTFLHWSYPTEEVQRLLPAGLTVEPWDGLAWVGVIPLGMRVRGPVGPSLPRVTEFPETNVRTYVRGPDGTPGIWFFSLDAANLPAVLTARATWGLPYQWAAMRTQVDGDRIRYESRRRGGTARHDIEVVVGDPVNQDDLSEFDHYLTARFTLWSRQAGRVLRTRAEHPPWRLRRATVERLDESLTTAAGLPAPRGEPLVHYSDGVDVRIGAPRVCGGVDAGAA